MKRKLLLITALFLCCSFISIGQTSYSAVHNVRGVGNSWGLDIVQQGDTLIVYTGVYCLSLPCCQSTSIMMLNAKGEAINQRHDENLIPAQFNFTETEKSLHYISQTNIKMTIGQPRTECISDSLVLTTIDKTNLDVTQSNIITFPNEFEYSIQGIIPSHEEDELIFFGQFDDAEMIQWTGDIDATAYATSINKSTAETQPFFTFNEYIANNQIVDLHVDESNNYHCLIYGQNDITAGAPVGDEKDPNWHIVSFDTSGQLINNIHYTGLSYPSNFHLLRLNDGNFIITSKRRPRLDLGNPANSWDGYRGRIVCVDGQSGDYLWDYVLPYHRIFDIRNYSIYDVSKTRNGDILVCGELSDTDDQDRSHKSGFIARFSPDGNLVWNRIFKYPDVVLFPQELNFAQSFLNRVKELEDGSIAAVGGRISFGEPIPQCNLWTVLLTSEGCLEGEECQEEITLDSIVHKTETDEYWPVGTTWYYDYDSLASNELVHGYIRYEIVDKYMQGNDTVYKVANNKGRSELVLRQDKLKMYFFNNDLSDFQLHYDFDSRSQFYSVYNQCDGPYVLDTILVDSVAPFWLPDNELDPMVFQEAVRNQLLEYSGNQASVLYGIGKNYGGLPFFNCDNESIGALRCFESNQIKVNFQDPWFSRPSCDNVWTETINSTSSPQRTKVNIHPNPTEDQLAINAAAIIQDLQIVDINGIKRLTRVCETKDLILNVTDLTPGVYFLTLRLGSGENVRRKFLKH